MRNQSIILASVIVLFVVGAFVFAGISLKSGVSTPPIPVSFAECALQGNPVAESFPRTCRTKEGILFTEEVSPSLTLPTPSPEIPTPKLASTSVMIQNITPLPNAKVLSPLEVRGEARGNWYFEASFPVKLENASGTVIAQGVAQAQGEWMTENFVPFIATLSWIGTSTGSGSLRLIKDNPSGLPEHAGEVTIPVTF